MICLAVRAAVKNESKPSDESNIQQLCGINRYKLVQLD